jgi:glycerol-3-phosphate dehydrogenase
MRDETFDLAIIGGGINGCGIARDAAGRGLSVYLCEQDDLASGTSSASTKLIHGGLRYLEFYEFRLVREALIEREVLWHLAPHIIWPLRFILPHTTGMRPAWLLRLGLFLYDHLGGRRFLPPTRTLDLRVDQAGQPLKPGFARAFEYSDCWVEDSRLVVLNAMDARERGALIETRSRLISAKCSDAHWRLTIEDQHGSKSVITAKILVNAAGPWVADVLTSKIRSNTLAKVRLVQGSHIVVKAIFDHDRSYIFQNADGRIFFAIPFEGDFTLIGTTDQDYSGDPASVHATAAEIAYLCTAASEYFARPITVADIVWSYSGVRPLYDDGTSKAQETTRDYVLTLDKSGGAPLVSVFGGKITTYRKLAEAVFDRLDGFLTKESASRKGWTATQVLPGGDFPKNQFETLVADAQKEFPFLSVRHTRRLARAYGTRMFSWLAGSRTKDDLGRQFGADLSEAEVRYLVEQEWAVTAQDILWRRSKLGLRLKPEEVRALDGFLTYELAGAQHDKRGRA